VTGSSSTGEAALREEEPEDSSSATKTTRGTRMETWLELAVEDAACRVKPPTPNPDAKA
jgi:hypothetical protein